MTEAGPGILWSVVPLELVLEGEAPVAVERVVEGRLMQVLPHGDGSATLVRLLSPRPGDYLDPRWQPGSRIALT